MSIRSVFNFIIFAPIAAILVILAVANRHEATLIFDPFQTGLLGDGVTMPLFVFLFAAAGLGVFIGGFAAWLRQGRNRQAAASNRSEALRLKAEVDSLRKELDSSRAAALPAPENDRSAAA